MLVEKHLTRILVCLFQKQGLNFATTEKFAKTKKIKTTDEAENQQSNTTKNITNKFKTQQLTKLRPLGEIIVNRLSLRVQLDEVHWDETIKLYTKAVEIYLYSVGIRQLTGMSRVFEQ